MLISPQVGNTRRQQFQCGRAAARQALTALGLETAAILQGRSREPIWPAGVVGSITHNDGWAAAVVAHSRACAGIGLDLETRPNYLEPAVYDQVCLAGERQWVDGAATARERLTRIIALFSAKEAIFKAVYPMEYEFFGFHDADLAWDESSQSFMGRLTRAVGGLPAGHLLRVRCERVDGSIMSGTCITRQGASAASALPGEVA
jgi:4'-phosphopantetheinyl transferase EntD